MRHPALNSSAVGDEGLAALAAQQGGVVSVGQLHALGFDRNAIAYRVRIGRLHRLHRGVYAVGHVALTPRGRRMAAVLACGPAAVASHRCAGALHAVRPTSRARFDVTARTHRRPPGIDVHRCVLRPEEITVVDGVPCTTLVRTYIDLADVVPPEQTRKAIVRGEQQRLVDFAALAAAVDAANGRRGQGVLRAILADYTGEVAMTASELEERMFALLRRANLPLPVVNTSLMLDGREVRPDFLWPAHRLMVETDGFATHGTRAAFEDDRARDAAILVAGFRVVRFTWRQIRDRPHEVARTLAALLAQTPSSPHAEQFSVR